MPNRRSSAKTGDLPLRGKKIPKNLFKQLSIFLLVVRRVCRRSRKWLNLETIEQELCEN